MSRHRKRKYEASDDQAHDDEEAPRQDHVTQEAVSFTAERCTGDCLDEWVKLRRALWPHESEQELRLEAAAILERPDDQIALIARGENLAAIAFAEATLRRDYVNGCTTSPVGFLEGLYVDPEFRHRGIARKLCRAVEDWAASLGCSEFASDVHLHNEESQKAHEALDFEATDRWSITQSLRSMSRNAQREMRLIFEPSSVRLYMSPAGSRMKPSTGLVRLSVSIEPPAPSVTMAIEPSTPAFQP